MKFSLWKTIFVCGRIGVRMIDTIQEKEGSLIVSQEEQFLVSFFRISPITTKR